MIAVIISATKIIQAKHKTKRIPFFFSKGASPFYAFKQRLINFSVFSFFRYIRVHVKSIFDLFFLSFQFLSPNLSNCTEWHLRPRTVAPKWDLSPSKRQHAHVKKQSDSFTLHFCNPLVFNSIPVCCTNKTGGAETLTNPKSIFPPVQRYNNGIPNHHVKMPRFAIIRLATERQYSK